MPDETLIALLHALPRHIPVTARQSLYKHLLTQADLRPYLGIDPVLDDLVNRKERLKEGSPGEDLPPHSNPNEILRTLQPRPYDERTYYSVFALGWYQLRPRAVGESPSEPFLGLRHTHYDKAMQLVSEVYRVSLNTDIDFTLESSPYAEGEVQPATRPKVEFLEPLPTLSEDELARLENPEALSEALDWPTAPDLKDFFPGQLPPRGTNPWEPAREKVVSEALARRAQKT